MGDKSTAVIRASVLEPKYGFRIHLSVSDYPYGQAKGVTSVEEERKNDAAFYVLSWPMAYIFLGYGYVTHGNIYHEVDHVVHETLRYIGIRESEDSAEAYTYLGQWIITWVYRQMKKNKVVVDI